MNAIFFDIETAPAPNAADLFDDAEIRGKVPTEFDPSSVKLGNMTNAEKIADKIAAAREQHEVKLAELDAKVEAARQKFIEDAALDPRTGRVLAIGYADHERHNIVDTDEDGLLREFWWFYGESCRTNRRMIGWNIYDFDLPFIVRRSWHHGVTVPPSVYTVKGGRLYWSDTFLDLRAIWRLGVWGDQRGTLDDVCRFLGLPGKNGDGKDFARLWVEDRETAMDYLRNDLNCIKGVAERLGVVRSI